MSLAAISTDNVTDAMKMAEFVGAEFYVLSDTDAQVARDYGIFDLHGDGVSAPATFIINPDGSIAASHVGRDITDRPTADQILQQVDRVAQ